MDEILSSLNDKKMIFEKYYNKTFDFKNLLSKNESIILKNSNNITIYVNSKINKVVIENCSNIRLSIAEIISGIDIERSDSIYLTSLSPKNINHIDCYKSNINIILNNELLKQNLPFKIINKFSKIAIL